ncbi:hypothetical protein GFL84_29625 [Rhizobium leguminosarum bv. viciae]|nr:hypothetical protein [Rhizobium leguminosarum bv. viciae]
MPPLCPAGHLPHKEGDRQEVGPSIPLYRRAAYQSVIVWGSRCAHPISPLVGEMPGRCPTRIDR